MSTYDRAVLRQELIRDEGLRLRVYRDSRGKLTIGVGRNLDRKDAHGNCTGITATETAAIGITRASVIANGITQAQAMALLDNDINDVEHELDHFLPWWRSMSPVRQRVIVNMCFNMGIDVLLEFHHTLSDMQAGRYMAASQGMSQSAWHREVGNRAIRLEAMMRTG